jgi:hypothetical protein
VSAIEVDLVVGIHAICLVHVGSLKSFISMFIEEDESIDTDLGLIGYLGRNTCSTEREVEAARNEKIIVILLCQGTAPPSPPL